MAKRIADVLGKIKYIIIAGVLLVSVLGESGTIKATDAFEDAVINDNNDAIVQEAEIVGTSSTDMSETVEQIEMQEVTSDDHNEIVQDDAPDGIISEEQSLSPSEETNETQLETGNEESVDDKIEESVETQNEFKNEIQDNGSAESLDELQDNEQEESLVQSELEDIASGMDGQKGNAEQKSIGLTENDGFLTGFVETNVTTESVSKSENGEIIRDVVETTTPSKDESGADKGTFLTDIVETMPPVQQTISDEALGYSAIPGDDEYVLPVRAADVVAMVMPVIPEGMFNYTLDPLRLLYDYGIHKEEYDGSTLYFRGMGAGNYSDTSEAAVATNKSSVPVLMNVTIQIENHNDWNIDYRDMSNLEAGENPGIGFSIVPVTEIGGSKVYHKDKEISVDENGYAHMTLYIPGTKDNFDEVGQNLVERADAQWSSAGFAIRGGCDSSADWSDIYDASAEGRNLTLHISYSMSTLSEIQKIAIESGNYSLDGETMVINF